MGREFGKIVDAQETGESVSSGGSWRLLALAAGAIGAALYLTAYRLQSSPSTEPELPALPNALTWLAIGDWGREGGPEQRQTAFWLGETANRINAAFVLSAGDNFYTVGVTNSSDRQWSTSWSSVYTHPGLATRPWVIIAGNHDYYALSKSKEAGLRSQLNWSGDGRWHFPSLNYTLQPMLLPSSRGRRLGAGAAPLDRQCLWMTLTDTCPFISDYKLNHGYPVSDYAMQYNVNLSSPDAQLAWLEGELQKAKASCDAIVVVGHHPVYSGGDHKDSADLIKLYRPLLDRYGVDAYIAGHDHTLIHLEAGATSYIVTGAGSQIRTNTVSTNETVWFNDVPGFTVHSSNRTHMGIFFVSGVDGSILHRVVKPLRAYAVA